MPESARPLVIAHRGDSAHAPENTLAAFDAAVAAGCDAIEFDLRLTADGVPVVCHDGDLRRFGGGALAIARRTASDLARADVGAWFARRFRGQRVPTLAEVLARYARKVRLLLELKADRGPFAAARAARLAEATVVAVAKAKARERVMILSFAPHALAAAHRCDPGLTLVLNAERPPRAPERLRAAGITAVDLDQRRVNAAVVARLKRAGLAAYTWTVDDERDLARVLAAGVDGVISNRPAWLRERIGS